MNITIQSISKSFGGRDIFTDFSLDVLDGMRLCVCGPNGCGKSTLLRIMAGVEAPDTGRVITTKNCRVGFVEQMLDESALDTPLIQWVQDVLPDWHDFWTDWESGHNDESQLARLAARQHELEAQYGYNPEHRAQSVLSGLGFSKKKWTADIRLLSGGWRERAKLARVLTAGADVLLLDEPTNHLDLDAVEWLEGFLTGFKGAMAFVAHDKVFMDRMATHVLYLGGSRPFFRKCNFTQFVEMQGELEEQREREAKRLSSEIERKMDFVRRFKAKATKARQAASRQKMAKKLERELENYQPEARRRELSFKWPAAAPSEKVVLSVAGLAFNFADGTKLWPPLTFSLFRGQRVAVVGHNGCGKSTLLKILAGHLLRCGGDMVISSNTRLGYYSQQQTETLNPEGSVLGEIRRLSDPRTTEEELMSVLGLFLLGQGYFERKVATLSGGERSRLALAVLFLARCNFLVLDEPTNHLDLESREALIEALDAYEGTLFMVAHDRHLLTEAADEIWAMDEHGITVYEGGFEEYDTARKAAAKAAQSTTPRNAADAGTAPANLSREDQKRLKREQAELRNQRSRKLKPLQSRYDEAEKKLEDILARQSEVEALLADPDVYNDSARATALMKEFHELRGTSETALEELALAEEELLELKKLLESDD